MAGRSFILTEPVTRRFVQATSDKWALVKMAQEKRPGLPVLLFEDGEIKVVGISP
jgi:hypothetical protein